jgi:ankyrin repeat protein
MLISQGNKENQKKKSYDIETMRKIKESLCKRDSQGRTHLHYAAFSGDLVKAQQLCCLGFPVDVTDKNLNTPLHVASEFGHSNFVSFITQMRPNVNRQNVEGKTALHLAVQGGHLQTTQLLLSSGANPNIPDLEGAVPLHYAVANNGIDIAKSLLLFGAFVNARDYSKETPLFYAIRESNSAIVDLLVNKFKADVNIANEDEESPLSYAKELFECDIVLILQGHTSQVSDILPSSSYLPLKSRPMQLPVSHNPLEQQQQAFFDRPQSL